MKDRLATFNERIKLVAAFFNAIGLGLIGFSILRPATEAVSLIGWTAWLWGLGGMVFHGAALYVLGYLRKEA